MILPNFKRVQMLHPTSHHECAGTPSNSSRRSVPLPGLLRLTVQNRD
jgi:hypothetical protein